jgi:Ca2+-binding EF-hand superfamily protein
VKNAANARFNALDRDHDGSLDRRELGATVTVWQFKRADADKKRILDKNQYLALVEKLFRAADNDHDGRLDSKELKSRDRDVSAATVRAEARTVVLGRALL